MGDAEHRQVTWNGYHSHIEKVVNDAYNDMEFSDMVIMAKDEPLTAHKIVLAGCSDYMRRAIKAGKQDQQLLFVFPSIESHIIKLVLEYMYTGEVTMHHTDVVDFMKVGEELKVKGLCDTQEKRTYNVVPDYQTNLKLGIVHSSYLAKQFASTTANQRLQQQLLQQQLGDRKRVSSPPPLKKRKRSITSHDNKLPAPASLPAIQVPDNINTMTAAATAAVTSETETAAAFSLPAIVSAQPFVDVNTLHLALQQRQIQLQQQQQQQLLRTPDTSSSDALPNSSLLNSSSSSDLNPLPLVKVEMTEEEEGDTTMAADEAPSSDSTSSNTTESASRAADAGAAAGATGGGAAHQPMDSDLPSTDIKSENVHEDERNGDDAQDPLESSCNGEETPLGGRLSPSGESAANESGTSVNDYLKRELQQNHASVLQQHLQQLQQQQHDHNCDYGMDDGSSEDLDMPALVVNEDPNQTFKCDRCDTVLANANLLKRHVDDKHNNTRKHLCEGCPKKFKRKEHLNRHFRIHSGEKPFECPICHTRFTQNEHLKGHIVNVHEKIKTKKKPKPKTEAFKKNVSSSTSPVPQAELNGYGHSEAGPSGLQLRPVYDLHAMRLNFSTITNPSSTAEGVALSMGDLKLDHALGVNTIGSSLTPHVNSALQMITSVPQPNTVALTLANIATKDDQQQQAAIASLVSSSRTSSPPSLTSPNTLSSCALTDSSPLNSMPQSSFAGSIIATENLASIMNLNTSDGSSTVTAAPSLKRFPILTNASPMNTVYTANLPTVAVLTSPSEETNPPTKHIVAQPAPRTYRGRGGRGSRGGRGVTASRRGSRPSKLSFDHTKPSMIAFCMSDPDCTPQVATDSKSGPNQIERSSVTSPITSSSSNSGVQKSDVKTNNVPHTRSFVNSPDKQGRKVVLTPSKADKK